MIWESGTVFVLGAGFTKAFLPEAPLLVDDYGGNELKTKYANFPEALSLMELELTHPSHSSGLIDLERLMTRLAGGMPYDARTAAEKSLALLLSEIKQSFVKRLESARRAGSTNQGELGLFAAHCVAKSINGISFNYDDLLDEALWNSRRTYDPATAWSPDWGYGFPCQNSETCMTGPHSLPGKPGQTLLFKLHGSVNWRILLGHPRPYAVNAIVHHEPWFEYFEGQRIPLETIQQFLESDPLLVPPILTKTDLVEQPILRLTWSLALQALKRSKRVVFIGYSLPGTDVAAGFLFREGLRHLDQKNDITVVDLAGDDKIGKDKQSKLLTCYGNVFPDITLGQFVFSGAAQWIRKNLTQWLFDSKGNPGV